ncbi:MAG: GspMb/PilO family protein [Candidatus Baltobacteraceae bacterium]
MKRRSPEADARTACFGLLVCAGVVLFAGGGGLIAHYERAIAAAQSHSDVLYAQTLSNDRVSTRAAAFTGLARSASRDLATLGLQTSQAGATAEFISTLRAASRTFRARVVSVEFEAPPLSAAQSGPFMRMSVVVKVRGHFADLMRFVSALPRQHALIGVDGLALTLAGPAASNGRPPLLEAVMHATVYRLVRPLQGAWNA